MATCIFGTTSISGYNSDKKRGGTVTGTFALESGSLPPTGSTLQSVKVKFSSIIVYSSSSPGFSTTYGNIALEQATSGGSQEHSMSASASILNFAGGNITFTVTGGGSDTANVLNVRAVCKITITIEYVPSTTSTGSLNKVSVEQNGAITLTVSPASTDFSHKAIWYRDASHTKTDTLQAGTTTDTLSVPLSWPVGDATVKLESYFGTMLVGSNTYSFKITVDPTTVIPSAGTISATVKQPSYLSAWGIFVKGISKAIVKITGASAGGGTFKSVTLTCGSLSQTTVDTMQFVTGVITETGSVNCTAKVTNNYGNSNEKTLSPPITVYDYESPAFLQMTAYRCDASGTPNSAGLYFMVMASVQVSSVGGNNALVSLQAQFQAPNSTAWSATSSLQNGTATRIGGNATAAGTYKIRFTAIDTIQNAQGTYQQADMSAATPDYVMFFKEGGLAVGFGKKATRNNAIEFPADWHVYQGDTQLDGTVPVSRGGTGGTTVESALSNLGAVNKYGDSMSGSLMIDAGQYGYAGTKNSDGTHMQMRADGYLFRFNQAGLYNALFLNKDASRDAGINYVENMSDGQWHLFRIFHAGMSTPIPVINGGTGSNDAANARTNLGCDDASNISKGTIGAARLPFKVYTGSTSINGNSGTYFDYSSAGFTSVPKVVASYSTDSGNWTGDNGAIKIHSKTTSGCQIVVGGSFSSSRAIDVIVIGT